MQTVNNETVAKHRDQSGRVSRNQFSSVRECQPSEESTIHPTGELGSPRLRNGKWKGQHSGLCSEAWVLETFCQQAQIYSASKPAW